MFLVFILALITPTIYQRLNFWLNKKSFYEINLREKSGLQIHHGHFGIIILFVTTIFIMFLEKNLLLVSLLGFGWGLLLDEIAPSLMMPSKNRELELAVYEKSGRATFLIFISVIILVTILYFFQGKY